MPSLKEIIRRNVDDVQQRISSALAQSGRTAGDVQLVAVTKYATLNAVHELIALGLTHLGESRPQQLSERFNLFDKSVCWHMIGHLQRNKVRRTLECATVIHSIDSLRLLAAVDRIAEELHVSPQLFLEVNISGESAKGGFTPVELQQCIQELEGYQHVNIIGLMTMAPLAENTEASRPHFKKLRNLRDNLQANSSGQLNLTELSMGMSRDYEIAIAEGATHIRVGSSLLAGLNE